MLIAARQILDNDSNLLFIRTVFPDHSYLYSNFIAKLFRAESTMDYFK